MWWDFRHVGIGQRWGRWDIRSVWKGRVVLMEVLVVISRVRVFWIPLLPRRIHLLVLELLGEGKVRGRA